MVDRLSEATAVRPAGDGGYATLLSPDWFGGFAPHGGYLAAILLRAMGAEVGDPARAPRSLTVHYPARPVDGPLLVRVTVERAGRSLTTVSARATQEGAPVALALAAFSLGREAPEHAVPGGMPEARPFEASDPVPYDPERMPPFFEQTEVRPALGARMFSGAEDAVSGGWMRLAEPEPIDAHAAAFLLDAWWPVIWTTLDRLHPAPTIDLTIHFRRTLPWRGGDRVLGRFRTTTVAEGFFEEDAELWAPDGTLLAQSRQLGLLVTPR